MRLEFREICSLFKPNIRVGGPDSRTGHAKRGRQQHGGGSWSKGPDKLVRLLFLLVLVPSMSIPKSLESNFCGIPSPFRDVSPQEED